VKSKTEVVQRVIFSIAPRRLSTPDAAVYLAVTNWRMEELLRDGIIPFQWEGRAKVVDVRDLDAYVDQKKN
jgi:hypothetical protein